MPFEPARGARNRVLALVFPNDMDLYDENNRLFWYRSLAHRIRGCW